MIGTHIRRRTVTGRGASCSARSVWARAVIAGAVVALSFSLSFGAAHRAAAAPRQWGTSEEQAFVSRINDLRASLGLAPLTIHPELQVAARNWAVTMKNEGHIFHASDLSVGISANWQKLGENVGVGGDVDALHAAFVASPKHYENLVDPAFTTIGVGVVWDGDRMFTAHRFMGEMPDQPAPDPAPVPEPDPIVVQAPPQEEPPPTAPTTTAAPTTTTAPPPPPSATELVIRSDARRLANFGS